MTSPASKTIPGRNANAAVRESTLASSELRVGGMDCASCATAVEGAVRKLGGVEDVRVDVVGGRVLVRHAARTLTRGDLTRAIQSVGYRVEEGDERTGAGAASISFWERRGRLFMAVAAGMALALALLSSQAGAPSSVRTTLLALATIAGGWYVVPRGLRAARNRALDMNFLMSVAAAGAWLIGERTEAAATLFLFAIAELLEAFSMDRARSAIRALMDMSPAEATVVRGAAERRIPVAEIEVGETIVVRPGEKIAVDGEITSGRSSVDQSPITGESMPVDKEAGDAVFAGSLNQQGALHVRSTKPASDTALARIIHAVEEAQASRAPSQAFVDRFARIYTPAVVLIAILIAVVPPAIGLGTWGTWTYRALAMLVVACPCALVISTPVSIVSGLAGAARGGVLIKGGAHLEAAGTVTTVCFDKTGTLTEGRPAVIDVIGFHRVARDEVLRLAAAVEHHSEHPLARAIRERASASGVEPPPAENLQALLGRGARAIVHGRAAYVGNERMAHELRVDVQQIQPVLQRLEREGTTAVIVAVERDPGRVQAIGVIAIADRVRSEAPSAVRSLRQAGIRRTIMLTGDNEGTARTVAAQVGVDEYHAGLLPDDKARIVREIEARGDRVAFVGDGVNDAPALASATVGMAMGAAGTDVALETADIALMGDDLSKLSLAIRLSHRTLTIIRQNIWFSIAVKAVFLVLAAGGWATLWMAVAADMGASLIVVLNGLRALRA